MAAKRKNKNTSNRKVSAKTGGKKPRNKKLSPQKATTAKPSKKPKQGGGGENKAVNKSRDFLKQFDPDPKAKDQQARINFNNAVGGGVGMLDNIVRGALPAITQTGQDLLASNLGEAGLASGGLAKIYQQISNQLGRNTAQQQRQELRGMNRNANLARNTIQNVSPEMERATNLQNQAINQTQRTAQPTNRMSAQAVQQQSGLAGLAMRQAQQYRDPTRGTINNVGREMMGASRGIENIADRAQAQAMNYVDPTRAQTQQLGREMAGSARSSLGLANQATDQAMNYVDPTAGLAQQAISGYQGLAGLQQGAAELAYERSGNLNPQQLRDSQQAAREAFASRGMAGTTGSVAAEILNREASLANRRAEAAQLGQLAQQGQSGLVGLASGYESDTLGRRTGLQQNASALQGSAGAQLGQAGAYQSAMESDFLNRRSGLQQGAAGLQGLAGQAYGSAGQFITGAESERQNRRQSMRGQAMGMSQAALAAQQGLRDEARGERSGLMGLGNTYLGYGLPLLSGTTTGQQLAGGILQSGMGMAGQGTGLLQAGINMGQAQYASHEGIKNSYRTAGAASDAGTMGMIGNVAQGGLKLLGGLGAAGLFSDVRLKDNLRHLGDIADLPVFEWDWNSNAPDKLQPNVGFIAQMVEQHGYGQFVMRDGEYLKINYEGLLNHLGSSMEEIMNIDSEKKGSAHAVR